MSDPRHRKGSSPSQETAEHDHSVGLTRRTVLAGAAATAALGLGGSEALAEAAPAIDDMEAFIRLSAALTGLAHDLLAPDTDSLGMRKVYFDHVSKKAPVDFAALLQIAKDANLQVPDPASGGIIGQADVDTLVQVINAKGDAKYLARSIVLMWYLGAWYEPTDLKALAQDQTHFVGYTVISAKAYTQGWLWRVAQAHPMGYSDMQFGYWTRPPEPLTEFITARPPKKGT
jgi:hypothetical protein